MTWVVGSLFELILSLLKGTLILLGSNFIGNIGINIGAQFSSLANPSVSLSQVLRTRGEGTGLFDAIFQGAGEFSSMFVVMGIVLAFCFGVVAIYSSLIGPLSDAEHPFVVAPRMIATGIACTLSYQIFLIFEFIGQKLYIQFQKIAYSAAVLNPNGGKGADFSDETYNIVKELEHLTTDAFDPDNISAMMGDSQVSGTESGGSLLAIVICTICVFLILINFFKLLLEMVERYAVLGVLFYTCPVAFSTLATKKTSGIFSSWIGMVVSQLILMITNCFFLNTFIGALVTFGMFKFKDIAISTYIVYMLLLVGWLKIGQNVDQYLKGMGLSTAQCGGHLSSAVGGAVGGLVASAVRMGTNKGMKAIGGKLGEKAEAKKAFQAEKAADFAEKQNVRNRQNGYMGQGGKTAAIKDSATMARGLTNQGAKAEAEKMVKTATAMANNGVAYKMNDGGGVKIGKNLGENGVNGVSNIAGGGQIQLTKDSPQARRMAEIASDGARRVKTASISCADGILSGAEATSYSLGNNRGEAAVVSSDNGMIAFASSATNSIHPTLERAGVANLENGNGVLSVPTQRFEGDQVYTSASGDYLKPISTLSADSGGVMLTNEASGNIYVCASDITKSGLDFLNNVQINADSLGVSSGWQGAELTADIKGDIQTVRGIELEPNLYKEMDAKGYFVHLEEDEFVDACFADPKIAVQEFDFGIR